MKSVKCPIRALLPLSIALGGSPWPCDHPSRLERALQRDKIGESFQKNEAMVGAQISEPQPSLLYLQSHDPSGGNAAYSRAPEKQNQGTPHKNAGLAETASDSDAA